MASEYEVDRMVVRLIGDQESYQKMLKDVEQQTKESAEYAEKQGSRIAEAFGSAFRTAQGMLSDMGSASKKAGAASIAGSAAISAPLGKAALDFSDYGKTIGKLVEESEKAAKAAAVLKKRTLEGTKAYEELNRVTKLTVEQASVLQVASERTGLSMETLTKTMKEGSDEYRAWQKEAEKFGLILGKDSVEAAEDLADSWTRVKQALKGMWTQVGAAVSDEWKSWNDLIVGAVTWTTKWIKENKELIQTISATASKLLYVGGALVGVGTALSTVSSLLGPITALVGTATAAWIAWDTATGKSVREASAGMWADYEASIKSGLDTIVTYGKQIYEYTDQVMTGVYDAIKGGNLELAVEIAWGGIKVAWIAGLQEIDELTGERFSAIFQNLAGGNWKNAAEAAFNEIVIIWNKLLIKVDPILTEVLNKASETWVGIVNALDEALTDVRNIVGMIRATFEDAAQSVIEKWVFVKTFFTGLTSFLSSSWESTFGKMLAGVVFVVNNALQHLNSVKEFALSFMDAMAGGLSTSMMAVVTVASSTLKALTGIGVDQTQIQLDFAAAVAGAGIETSGLSLMGKAMSGSEEHEETTTAVDVEKKRAKRRTRKSGERQEDRLSDQEDAANQRLVDTANRLMMANRQIVELEARRAELAAQGKEDADAKLATEQEALENAIAQAKTEAERAEAERAAAMDQKEVLAETRRQQEISLRIDQEKQRVKERYDPVTRYMRQMKELNSLFEEGERSTDVYKKALEDIEEELANSDFKVEVEFGLSGMDAVRDGTREEQRLIENTLLGLEKKRVKEEALAEAKKRQREFDEVAAEAELQREAMRGREVLDQMAVDYQSSQVLSNPEAELDRLEGGLNDAASIIGENRIESDHFSLDSETQRAFEAGQGFLDPEATSSSLNATNDQAETMTVTLDPDISNSSSTPDLSVGLLERIAEAVEDTAETEPVILEPLGVS